MPALVFSHLGYRRPTAQPRCVIEAFKLVGCHVGRYLAQGMLRIAGHYADGVVLWMASASANKSTVSLLVDQRRTGADDVSCRAG